jgi:hypothetical protein
MLKVNVGLSRKIGEANYGSRGATVNLEIELDSSLAAQPDQLHDRIRQLFRLAKSSIDEELNGHGPSNGSKEQNGHSTKTERPATVSQVRAIHAIADRQKTDLVGLLRGRYHVDRTEDLSVKNASDLIDHLKDSANGSGVRR